MQESQRLQEPDKGWSPSAELPNSVDLGDIGKKKKKEAKKRHTHYGRETLQANIAISISKAISVYEMLAYIFLSW